MDGFTAVRVANMSKLKRGMVIDVNLDPVKGSETGKIRPCVIVKMQPHWSSIKPEDIYSALPRCFSDLRCFPHSG